MVQARRAQAVQALVVRLFSESDPAQAQGRSFTARELLDRRVTTLDAELRNQPELKADMERKSAACMPICTMSTALGHLRKSVQGYDDLGADRTEAAIEARLLLTQSLTVEAPCPTRACRRSARCRSRNVTRAMFTHWRCRHDSPGRIDFRSGRSQEAADRYRSVIDMDHAQLPPSTLRLSALSSLAKAQYDLELLTDMLQTLQRVWTRGQSLRWKSNPVPFLDIELRELMLRFDLGQMEMVPPADAGAHHGVGKLLWRRFRIPHVARDYWSMALAAAGQYLKKQSRVKSGIWRARANDALPMPRNSHSIIPSWWTCCIGLAATPRR